MSDLPQADFPDGSYLVRVLATWPMVRFETVFDGTTYASDEPDDDGALREGDEFYIVANRATGEAMAFRLPSA